MSVDYRPDYDPADVNSDYGHTGGDITVPTFTGDTRPFRFWCQKALPLVYDDSLSYYEVLCKMADYMNNFVTDLTTVEDSMTEFGQQFVINQQFLNSMADQLGQNVADLEAYINDRMDDFMAAYTQLQTYVNNYFDNLDVQEEINTKLDEMASDGTLNDLFDPVLETWMQQKTAQIDAAIANQDTIQAAQNARISVLEGRMDTFSGLPSGSTSGNAELLDIRTNFLGETYPTAGDAVRASDMIASGFQSIHATKLEEWDGNDASSVYDSIQIDVSGYKGGHVAVIGTFKYFLSDLTELGNCSVYGTNTAGAVADSNAANYYPGGNNSVFTSYTQLTTSISGEERLLLQFAIPDAYAYQYLKIGHFEHGAHEGTYTEPLYIVYANSWSKTQVDPTLSIAGAAADAKAAGDAIDQLNERLDDFGAVNHAPISTTPGAPGGTIAVVGANGKYTINGTFSYQAYYEIYKNASGFPSPIKAGDKILCGIYSSEEVKLDVYQCVNGSFSGDIIEANTFKSITINQNATGLMFRLRFPANVSYTNATAYPYLLTTLSKQEIKQSIDALDLECQSNETEISELKQYMPYEYEAVVTTTNTGIVNKWNEVAPNSTYAYIKQAVVSGDKYEVSGYYFGGNYPAYLILNGNTVMSFHNEDSQSGFNNLEVTIPEGATHIVINGYPGSYPASMKKYVMAEAGTDKAKNYDSVLVGIGDHYSYNDINDAILENPNSIISVDFGTYETEIQNLATDKKIIGKDKDLCILTGTNKDYDTPPIEIAGGIVKNFTVTMQNDASADHNGYCLHSDNSATVNKTLLVENCKFSCTGQHAVGIGVRSGETLIFENCYFEQLDNGSTSQPIYIHNNDGDNPVIIKFHNCYFHGNNYCMKLQAWGSGMSMQFEFIDCTCLSETYGVTDDCVWTDYVSGSTHDTSKMHEFSGKATLLPTSHGNNVDVLNYN